MLSPGIALYTKDADVMLVPPVAAEPDIERAMRAGGFTSGVQPGIWISGLIGKLFALVADVRNDEPQSPRPVDATSHRAR